MRTVRYWTLWVLRGLPGALSSSLLDSPRYPGPRAPLDRSGGRHSAPEPLRVFFVFLFLFCFCFFVFVVVVFVFVFVVCYFFVFWFPFLVCFFGFLFGVFVCFCVFLF